MEQYSNRPSNAGQSSPTLTGHSTPRQPTDSSDHHGKEPASFTHTFPCRDRLLAFPGRPLEPARPDRATRARESRRTRPCGTEPSPCASPAWPSAPRTTIRQRSDSALGPAQRSPAVRRAAGEATDKDLHLFVEPVVHHERVRHPDTMRLHRVPAGGEGRYWSARVKVCECSARARSTDAGP